MDQLTRGGKFLDGTVRIFLSEALVLPTGLVTAAFLTRSLGPTDFGLFSLAATLVTWLEWTSSSLFARATFKIIAERSDWRATGAAVLWLSALTSVCAAITLWMLAPFIASILHEPGLSRYLRVFTLDIPFFALAQCHRNILVGIGEFRHRAVVSAWRWTAKMLLVIALVSAGLSVTGAIIGSILASVVELAVSRYYVRPSFVVPRDYPMRRLWSYALPLFVGAVAVRLLDRIDLFMVTALGGSAATAGQYGAAQNLSVVPALLSLAVSGLLLSALTHSLGQGDAPGAREMGRNAMRLIVLLLPFAAMTAGAARGIVVSIFGAAFAPAAPLLALLIFGALALSMVSVASAIITAAGRPVWVMYVGIPLVPLALGAHLLLIPRFGARGAASVTLLVAVLGAVVCLCLVQQLWTEHPPVASTLRSMAVSVGAYAAAAAWVTPGPWIAAELLAIALAVLGSYLVLGELAREEIAFVKHALWRPMYHLRVGDEL